MKHLLTILLFIAAATQAGFSQKLAIGSGLLNDQLVVISGASDTLVNETLTSTDDVDLYCKVVNLPMKRQVLSFYVNSLRVSDLSIDNKILKKKTLIVIDFNFAKVDKVKYLVNVDYKWIKQ